MELEQCLRITLLEAVVLLHAVRADECSSGGCVFYPIHPTPYVTVTRVTHGRFRRDSRLLFYRQNYASLLRQQVRFLVIIANTYGSLCVDRNVYVSIYIYIYPQVKVEFYYRPLRYRLHRRRLTVKRGGIGAILASS